MWNEVNDQEEGPFKRSLQQLIYATEHVPVGPEEPGFFSPLQINLISAVSLLRELICSIIVEHWSVKFGWRNVGQAQVANRGSGRRRRRRGRRHCIDCNIQKKGGFFGVATIFRKSR